MKRIGFWSKLGVLIGTLVVTPALATELVVYKAEGIALVPGQTISDASPLTLAAGQRVTLLASNGSILNLEGPFNAIPTPKTTKNSESGMVETLKMLVNAPKTRSGGLGTTRNIPTTVDVTSSKDYCLYPEQKVVFVRPNKQKSSTISVRMGGDLWKAHAQWPAGTEALTPPPTMPIADGGVYQLELDGIKSTVKLHIMPQTLNDATTQATWKQSKGCATSQLAAKN